jgi:hypothetical protein
VFANLNGGKRTGATAEGLLELDLDMDLEKCLGLKEEVSISQDSKFMGKA